MIPLKQSTASQEIPLGRFVDSTDGDTEETGLTIANTDIKLWKNGATTLANKNSGGATHIANGVYYAVLDATDTDTLGPLKIFIHVSGALDVQLECVVYPAIVYDALFAGTDYLQVDTVQVSGTSQTANDNGADINAILLDTAEIGTAGAGLTNINLPNQTMDITGDITGNLSGSVGSVTGNVGGIAGTLNTLDDLDTEQNSQHSTTQSAIATAQADLDILTGTDGATLATAQANYAPAKAGDEMDLVDAPNATAVTAIQSGLATPTNITAGTITTVTNLTNNNDKAGYSLSAAGIQAIWDALTSALTTVGSIGKLLVDNIDTALSGLSSHSAADVWAVATRVLTANTNLNDPTAAAIADQVWVEAIADHSGTSGSTAEALNAAGAAGDPWTTALPGAYGAGSAGYIVGNNLDVAISGLNDLSAAEVNAEVDTALSDYDPPTKTEMDTAFTQIKGATWATTDTLEAIRDRGDAAWITATTVDLNADQSGVTIGTVTTNTDMRGTDNAATAAALSTHDGKLDTVDTNVDAVLVDTGTTIPAQLDDMSGATFNTATDSLEAIRDRGDAAWTTGAGGSAPTVEEIRTEMDDNSTQLAAIVADTNELQGDWTNGGRLDLILDELTTQGDTNEGKIDTVDANVDSILTDTGTTIPAQISGLNNLSAADVNAEVDTALSDYDPPTKAELDSGLAALNDIAVADILTTQMTESYAADGAAPTLAQALCLIQQQLGDFTISGTTLTVNKLDGSTPAATFTLNDATTPTSVTRAT